MNTLNPTIDQNKRQQWFDELVQTLRVHEVQLETDTATEERKVFYDTLMSGNMDEISSMNKQSAQRYFVSRIINEYLNILQVKRI